MCIRDSSICKLEREYEENYFVDIGQMVDFPQVYFKPRILQMFLKGKSPLEETNVFSSSPLIFSRRFYDLIPSVWNDRKSMKWCYGKRYFDRKTETFKVSRGYNELAERLDIERFSDIKYLPWDETGTAADNNNDEIIIDLIVTDHTKGCLLYTSRCV